jgi:hypothetical protein
MVMQKHYIDITELTNIKDIFEKSASFADKKNDEIVILVDQAEFRNNNLIQILYPIIGEGILNYHGSSKKPRIEFDYNISFFGFDGMFNYNGLASQLTKLTGIKFSAQVKELVN